MGGGKNNIILNKKTNKGMLLQHEIDGYFLVKNDQPLLKNGVMILHRVVDVEGKLIFTISEKTGKPSIKMLSQDDQKDWLEKTKTIGFWD